MRRLLTLLLATGISSSVAFTDGGVPVAGKSGEGLAAVLRRDCRPQRLVSPTALSLTLTDMFSGRALSIRGGAMPDGYVAGSLVCHEWWLEEPCYGDTVMRDLVNFYPLSLDVRRHRADFPPGVVDDPRFDNGIWRSGLGHLSEVETEFYEPPVALRGRLARTYFYMAVIYPQEMMRPRAYTMFTGRRYPSLTPYASRMMLEWHAAYPPDAEELELNAAILTLQGNTNPFVDDPLLADYLWGQHAGEPYPGSAGEPMPLHSTYTVGDIIHLHSPHIPSGASWTIDGVAYGAIESITASSLGVGAHEFNYTTSSSAGVVMIRIER